MCSSTCRGTVLPGDASLRFFVGWVWGHPVVREASACARHATRRVPIHFCQQTWQAECGAAARAVHAFIYTPGGALRSRKSSFFRGAGPNLTRLIVAAGKETHTAAYQPPRRHSSRGVPSDPAEAARAAGGCLVRSRPVRRRRRGTIQRGLERGCKIKTITPPHTYKPRAAPSHYKGPSTPSPRRRGRRSLSRPTAPATHQRKARGPRERRPETPPRS